MPVPDNPEALHGFLGMLNYLHEFIEDYNEKTAALHASLTNAPSGDGKHHNRRHLKPCSRTSATHLC